jgi:hypothetical protein
MQIAIEGDLAQIIEDSGPLATTGWQLREVVVNPNFSFRVSAGQQYVLLARPSTRLSMDRLQHFRNSQVVLLLANLEDQSFLCDSAAAPHEWIWRILGEVVV